MSNSGLNGSAHILVFPFPAQGHMLPLLDLTHLLALRGLTITILVTPKNLPFLQPLLTRQYPSPIQTFTPPFPNTTGSNTIPLGIENMKDLPFSYFPTMMQAMSELRDPIIHWFQSHAHKSSSSLPVAILSDLFLGWTYNLSCQLNICRIVFVPTSAHNTSLINYLWRNLPKKDECDDPCYQFSAPELPGSPVFPLHQVFLLHPLYEEESPIWDFLRKNNNGNRASWGIVLNSFTELEEPYFNHLKMDLDHDRVWAVGPLLPMNDHDDKKKKQSGSIIERGGPSAVGAEQVMSWLDSLPDRSVVYICFGTQIVLNVHQMDALGKALDESGTHFICCIKDGVFPPTSTGFEDLVGERGLLIKGWAPQVAILRHRAVAAYLTHCGWNSVLEGLIAGVQLLLWPMGADHFLNTKLLGDELGLAVKVCEGAETVPNSTELAQVLAESVRQGELTQPQMVRAMEMRKLALEAVEEGGSSYKSLDEFVERMNELNVTRNTV